jgi:protein SCO1
VPSWAIAFALTLCTFINAPARTYTIDGIVVSVENDRIMVAHRPVRDVMPAMTMPFRVRDTRELAGLQAGMRVRFRFDGHTASRIRQVRPNETGMPAPERTLVPGAAAPDFRLTNQSGRTVRLADFRGKVVALNFLYTRCPVPEICPRLAAAFAYVHKRTDATLISITVDPVYDTPSVLASYAKLWRARPELWHFLTGSQDNVAEVGRDYGLVYWPEEGAVAHTARTYVIGRDGVVAAVLEGTSWRAEQLLSLIERQMEARR